MTDEELLTHIKAAARRLPLVRQIEIKAGVRLVFEDGVEVMALPLPDHGLVRLYAACIARVDEAHPEPEFGNDESYFATEEDEGESVELRTDEDGRWSIYCSEDETACSLVLDLPEAALEQPRRDEILERFVGELAYWTKTFNPLAHPAPDATAHLANSYRAIEFN